LEQVMTKARVGHSSAGRLLKGDLTRVSS